MNQNRAPRTSLFAYLVVVAAFALGVLADRMPWLTGPTSEPAGVRRAFTPFWETWNLVDRYYVDRPAVDPQKMTRGAIQGMLNSLGDVGHTTYLSPQELKELEQSLSGYFEGIGARMTVRKGQATVVTVLPKSPALSAGLKAGDVITAVNDQDVRSQPLTRIVQLVRGPAGTTVKIQVTRHGESKPLTLEIARGRVEVDDVSWHMLPGTSVAHVAILEFGSKADEKLRAALEAALAAGARGIVLDVRGNPGGLKDQAVAVTSEFLDSGNVFLSQDAHGKREAVPVVAGGVATRPPLVLLVDEGTASSAEILAGALQDHHRAQLVGSKTFGTGTVLKPFLLKDGSAVLLAVEEWFTPNGRQIWHTGIRPDIEVTLPTDAAILLPDQEGDLSADQLAKSEDKQLLKALHELQGQLDKKPTTHGGAAKE